jgi:hypothetical protein
MKARSTARIGAVCCGAVESPPDGNRTRVRCRSFTVLRRPEASGCKVALNVGHDDFHIFLSIAEIAGVFVAFVALISFRAISPWKPGSNCADS